MLHFLFSVQISYASYFVFWQCKWISLHNIIRRREWNIATFHVSISIIFHVLLSGSESHFSADDRIDLAQSPQSSTTSGQAERQPIKVNRPSKTSSKTLKTNIVVDTNDVSSTTSTPPEAVRKRRRESEYNTSFFKYT